LFIAGANIESILYNPKQILKKINLYICQTKNHDMLLTVDVGNSRIKAAVFEQDTLVELFVADPKEAAVFFSGIFIKYPKIKSAIYASVGKIEAEVLDLLQKHVEIQIIDHTTVLPFTNNYKTPKTLGVDCMVLAAGATLLYPKQNRLVIDAGTCVTYDFIDQNNRYLGGAISPGIVLRYKSLNDYTQNLPFLESNSNEIFIQYFLKYQDLTVILTGGDAEFLAKRLKNTIFANSNFLLDSLRLLSTYIHQND